MSVVALSVPLLTIVQLFNDMLMSILMITTLMSLVVIVVIRMLPTFLGSQNA